MKWRGALPVILAPAMVLAQMHVDGHRSRMDAHPEILYLWSGRYVRRFAPGFETLAADLYWLRTVQYFGAQRAYASHVDFALLEPLIDITVSLDPKLEIAYRYGAIFLSEPLPSGKGDPRAGIALLERGTRALPASWRLRQDMGYYTFLFLGDSHRAAEILSDAAHTPGAPFWLNTMAAGVLSKAGDRQAAREMWRRMYEQAEDGFIKDNARYNVLRLDAEQAMSDWSDVLSAYKSRNGRWPLALAEISGPVPPRRDPTGTEFRYDPTTGHVSIAPDSGLRTRKLK